MFDPSLVPDNIRSLIRNNATAAHFLHAAQVQGFGYRWFLEQLVVALAQQNDAMITRAFREAIRNPRPIVIDENGELVHA